MPLVCGSKRQKRCRFLGRRLDVRAAGLWPTSEKRPGTKSPDRIDGALVLLHQIPFLVCDDLAITRRAAELSVSLDHLMFDMLYHAVALEKDATVVTADDVYVGGSVRVGYGRFSAHAVAAVR